MQSEDSVIAVFADHDNFLVMAHGSPRAVACRRTILSAANPSRLDVHAGAASMEHDRLAVVSG